MGMLALTLATLLLGQVRTDHVSDRAVQIPIDFKNAVRSELKEILLFASWDQGKTYQQVAKALPEQKSFVFQASTDGTCFLKVAVVDRRGQQTPPDVLVGGPDGVIIIDTMKPVMKSFAAQRQGDEVEVSWEILELHFDPAGFRLEYQPKDNPSAFWSAVTAPPGLTGKARFRPNSAGPLLLRLTAKDYAGNQSITGADLTGTISTVSHSQPMAPPTNSALPPPLPPPSTIEPTPAATTQMPVPPPVTEVKSPLQQQPMTWAPPPGAAPETKDRLVASSDQLPAPKPPVVAPPPSNPPPPAQPQRPAPKVRYVNHPKVLLEYDLKVGRSGVGSVDLYMTRDDGRTWEHHASDTEIRGMTLSGKQQATVDLPGEGVYGFILIVKSRAGLGKPAPKPNDPPEIIVEVDTTPPRAELFISPSPEKQSGYLILKWLAKDTNLAPHPITLEWAAKPGEWQPIARDIENTGIFNWQVPDSVPVEVYLRLRVSDMAGNETVAATQQPQLIDLSEPEGTITNASAFRRPP